MAGSIDNLNFEIILKDDEFGKRVQENMKLAKELNVSLTALLDLQSKIKATGVKTPNATQQIVNQEKVAAAQKKTAAAEEALAAAKKRTQAAEEALAAATARRVAAEQRAIAATARSVNAQTSLQRSINRTTSAAKMQAGLLGDLKGLALQYLSIRGVASFISSLVRVTGEFELQKTTLSAMLGDLSQAQAIMSDIKGLAVQSPFQFKELATYAKQLTAFAVPAEQLFETTKMLADVSAGLGVGMDRIVLAYGQVRSAAFLRGQEVRQFTEAGIPILNMLAKQFEQLEGEAISVGEVFDRISSRMVSFEMVNQVFKDLTSEGGKFYKMQETQAETLRGKISNLTDAYEMMLNEMGSKKSGFLKGSVDALRGLMTHWEAVGKTIGAVVVALGVYKTTLALIAVAEKIAATKTLIHKWQLLNSVLKGMGKNVNSMKTAWTVFGTSAKTALGLAGAAAGALLTIIISNISKIGELKRELNGIVASEALKSDKSVRNLDLLVEKLKNATQGSQEYRDIISQLNRQYGEYLPKVLSEADAYNNVAVAAQAAAEAIRSKAKASAYDRGMETIEEKYGKNVESNISSLIKSITTLDPSIAQESASRFVSTFIAALKKEGGRDDAKKTFTDTFNSYFGEGSFDSFIRKYKYTTKDLDFAEVIKNQASNLSHATQQLEKEEEKFNNILDARFTNTAYDSYKEEQRATTIETEYQKALLSSADSLNKKVLTQKEYNKEVKKLDIKRLEDYIALYKELGRQDKVDFYQLKLDALKVPEGWRGRVQGIIEDKDLDKYSSFGLWADETTNSVDYVEDMVKRYKELKEQIDLVQPFDEKQAKRLKQNKELIEDISKALGLDIEKLAASKGEQAESKEEKRIKRLVEALRTLQDQYEKLKEAGASDKSIKTLFEGLYPDLIKENGKEFVTDLNYLERAIGLVAELEKIAPDDAKKLLVGLGKDEFSVYLKNLQDQNKEYKNIASSAKEYFNLLRNWKAEDFNLEGEGISFDIDKISTGFASKVGEIDLKTRKLQELFNQIGISDTSKRSEEAIAKIKEIFEKEFGEGSWDKFYEEFLSKGDSAFKTLADKEIAYERKIAQEKITNLAKAYVGDMTEKLDMSDWSDKSLGQIEFIRSELMKLMKSDIPISDSLRKELELLGLNTDDLIAKIKELFGGKFDTATIEKIKAVQEVAKGVSSYSQMVGESLATLGESMNSDFLTGAAKAVSLLGDMADAIMESESLMAKLTLEFGDVSNLSEEATENLENIAQSSDWITVIIKVILSAVTAVSNVIATQRKNMELAVDAAIAYRDALAEIARENANTIFGTKQISILVENLNAASEAYRVFKKELDNAMSQDRGEGGWYLPSIGGEGGEGYWFETYKDLKSLLGNKTFENEKELMEYLKANIDYWESLTHLSDGERTTAQLETEIRNLIKVYDAWDKANKLVKASMTELFGKLGDDIASNMINSFLEVGKATANLEESFESLGETILQSFLKTAIIEDVLMPRLEAISGLMTKAVMKEIPLEEFASQLGNVAEEIKSDLTEIGPIWEQIMASFQENGLLPDSESSAAADLGAGIKGITEDTANLLASYLNAIRADVSYSKTLWARMDGNLQRIADMFASSPSLMEYQAQIAANTYNTAIHTQEILYSLKSVITFEDGPAAVRVLS